MAFSKALLLKGLAGAAAVGAVGGGVVFREDIKNYFTGKKETGRDVNGQLNGGDTEETQGRFNRQLKIVNAPGGCRFGEEETEETVECSVSKEELITMKFYGGESWKLKEDGVDLSGMKLRVQSHKKVDFRTEEEGRGLILTFRDYKRTVELKNESEKVIVSLVKDTNPEFEIEGRDNDLLLYKIWEPSSFGESLGLNCLNLVGDDVREDECRFVSGRKIKVGRGTDDHIEELDVSKSNGKFELKENVEGYNQGFKFVFKGKTVSGREGVSLENGGEYEFRWKLQDKDKVGYLVKRAQ